jgi:hypothetical protein
MTDRKGRERWERGENKSRGGRCGGDEPKNVREPERVVGWLACRVESNFLPHDLDSTAPYLNPVTYSTFHLPPLFIFLYYFPSLPTPLFSLLRRHSPALRFLLTLPLPSTHALILNSLLTTFVLSCSVYPYHTSSSLPPPPQPIPLMSTKGRSTPRVVCCAIPIARAAGKVLVITSRKRPNYWVCESLPSPFNLDSFADSACFLKCRKAVGSPQTLCSRLLPRERPGKKVESFVPLPVPPHPDIHFAHCSHCCGFLL